MAMQWNNITPNFNSSTATMRNAIASVAQATDTFEGINKLKIQEEQMAVENMRAEEAAQLQREAFGLQEEQHNLNLRGEKEAGDILGIFNTSGIKGLEDHVKQFGNPTTQEGAKAMYDVINLQADRDYKQQVLNFEQATLDRANKAELAQQKALASITPDMGKEEAAKYLLSQGVSPQDVKRVTDVYYGDEKNKSGSGSGSGNTSTDGLFAPTTTPLSPSNPLRPNTAVVSKMIDTVITDVSKTTGIEGFSDVTSKNKLTNAITNNLNKFSFQGKDGQAHTLNEVGLSNAIRSYLINTEGINDVPDLWLFGKVGDLLDNNIEQDTNLLNANKANTLGYYMFDALKESNGGSISGFSPELVKTFGSPTDIEVFNNVIKSLEDGNPSKKPITSKSNRPEESPFKNFLDRDRKRNDTELTDFHNKNASDPAVNDLVEGLKGFNTSSVGMPDKSTGNFTPKSMTIPAFTKRVASMDALNPKQENALEQLFTAAENTEGYKQTSNIEQALTNALKELPPSTQTVFLNNFFKLR